MATSAQTAAPSSGTAAPASAKKSAASTPKVTRPAVAKAAPTVRKATAVAKTSSSTAKQKAKVAAKPAVKPANKVAAAPVRKASGATAVKSSKKVVAASSTAKVVAKTGASSSRKPATTSLAAKPGVKPAVKSPVRPLVAAGKVSGKAKPTAAASPRAGRPKASAVVAGSSTKPDRTPSPPASLSQKKPLPLGAAKVVSAGSGNVVTTSVSRPQSKPPFSPDDDEAIVEEASSDGFELAEKEMQGAETQGKQESLIVGRPAGSLDIEMSPQSETPMVSLFGMAGGAGAAAMTADPLAPTAGGREAVPGGLESAVGAPVSLPPSASSPVLPVSPAPEISASDVSDAQPKVVAPAEGAALGKITFSSPEDEFSAAPSQVEITMPRSSQESVLTASLSAPDEFPALSAPPVETTVAPLREETASIAGTDTLVVAEQLDEPLAPTAVVPTSVEAAVAGEGSPGKGRVRATVSSLEREAVPVGGEGVNHVVATSLQADGAVRSEVDGAPTLAEEASVRMALPPAPDQRAPQRAE